MAIFKSYVKLPEGNILSNVTLHLCKLEEHIQFRLSWHGEDVVKLSTFLHVFRKRCAMRNVVFFFVGPGIVSEHPQPQKVGWWVLSEKPGDIRGEENSGTCSQTKVIFKTYINSQIT